MKKLVLCYIALLFIPFSAKTQDFFHLSEQQYEQRNFDSSLYYINKAIKKDKHNGQYLLYRANIHYRLQEYELSVQDCYAAKALNADNAEINLLRGKISSVSDSYGIALMFYNKVVEGNADDHTRREALIQRGLVKIAMHNETEGINDIQKGIANDTTLNGLHALGVAYNAVNEKSKAVVMYQKILNIDPQSYVAHIELVKYYIDNKRFSDAKRHAVAASEITETRSEALNYLGLISFNLGEYDQALSYINASLEADPFNFNAFKNRAFVYFKLNADKNACDDLFRSMQYGYFESKEQDVFDLYMERCEN